jgi:hypothetical protein
MTTNEMRDVLDDVERAVRGEDLRHGSTLARQVLELRRRVDAMEKADEGEPINGEASDCR